MLINQFYSFPAANSQKATLNVFLKTRIFLKSGSSNQVMQNPIPITSKKPGFFYEKVEFFDELQLTQILIFFAEILHEFST